MLMNKMITFIQHTYLLGIGGVSNETITITNATIGDVSIEK